jgi:glycosyltransferase involved in cell wall biosynthesis
VRVSIVSRIFEPEPSAASFRLSALAHALTAAGHDVTVLTVRPPRRLRGSEHDGQRAYRVKRFPVLRDASGYVRGYVQYLSFDIPLFFRILLSKKPDLVIVEPPPTTGFFARWATRTKGVPYAYYAADIWSDASSQTGAPALIVRAVRQVERWVWRGARAVLSVSAGVTGRLRELEPTAHPVEIGNGVDVRRFQAGLSDTDAAVQASPAFVYAGTTSEWHGAAVLVRAYAAATQAVRNYPLRFIGGGSEQLALSQLADSLGVCDRVQFEPTKSAEELAPILARSVAAVATLKPGSGYDFAFPTKLYSAAVCGAPLIFAGPGPAREFVQTEVEGQRLGSAVTWDENAVRGALEEAAAAQAAGADSDRRRVVRDWAAKNVSLEAVAKRAVSELERRVQSGTLRTRGVTRMKGTA